MGIVMAHLGEDADAKDISGMLLYPDVGRSLRLKYRLLNIPVVVATINLGREWHEIEAELHELLDQCATAACSDQRENDDIEFSDRSDTIESSIMDVADDIA